MSFAFNSKVHQMAVDIRKQFSDVQLKDAKAYIESQANGDHFDGLRCAEYLVLQMDISLQQAAALIRAWNLYII